MKNLIFLTLFFLSSLSLNTDWFEIFQADIFVDATNGSDSNSGSWFYPVQTIAAANALATANDRIGLRSGQTWNETVIVPGNSITYKKVGKEADPIILGFTTVTVWTQENDSIWSKTLDVESNPEIVTVNGVQYAMGRTPNSDRYSPTFASYYHIDSHTGTTIITDSECNSAVTDWDGAELVFKIDLDMNWQRCPIVSHTGTSLTITNTATIGNNYGYFIQGHLATLNQFGEWYYGGGKLYMYFGTANPNDYTVKIAAKNTLIDVNTRDSITIKNIIFEGANANAIETNSSSLAYKLTVDNCTFNFNNRGVYGHTAPLMTVRNCRFINQAYMAIYNHYWSEGAHMVGNYIDSTGLVIGSGSGEGDFVQGIALYSAYGRHKYTNQHTIIEKNRIFNSAYMGIFFGSDSAIVRNNYIDKFNLTKSDGGAIYSGIPDSIFVGMVIDENICLNGDISTDADGQPQYNTVLSTYIIYLDNTTDGGTTVSGNTMAHTMGAGLMIHMSKNVTITGNTIFDCTTGVKFQELAGYDTPDISGITMNGNKIISKTAPQKVLSARSLTNDFSTWGTIDSNYYAKPIDGDPDFITMVNTFIETVRDSASWRTYASQDATSTFVDIQIQDDDSIRFYTNPTSVAVVYALSDTLIDATGTAYNTSVTVPAYGSVVLWNDDAETYTPVFVGVQTVGGSAFNSSIRQAMPVTMTQDGYITAIVMYMGANTTTTARVKLGLYTNSGALPSTKIGETDATEQLTYAGFLRVNLIEPVAVTNGTTYWFAWVFEHTTQAYYAAGTPGRANTTGTTFADGMPSSFGSATTAASAYTGGVVVK